MGTKTGKIRYNVTNRGRQHRGKDRRFDLRALASLVNSPAIQERVKNRDMHGYYGHWQRMKFGANTDLIPPETVVVQGKVVNIEPAFVTTHLWADADGNIEHEAEFLDNAAGKIAARLYQSKTGGFSSAMNAIPRNNFDVPQVFAGFDYVLEPNYTTNRGYVFDSVGMEGMETAVLDSIMLSDINDSMAAMNALYDGLQNDHLTTLQAMNRLREENEELLSMLTRSQASTPVLDSAHDAGQRPMIVDQSAMRNFKARHGSFIGAALPGYEKTDDDGEGDTSMDRIHRHYGVE